MSSSSLYVPDDDSDSEFDHEPGPARGRRSVSRIEAISIGSSPMDGAMDAISGAEGMVNWPFNVAQNRFEKMYERAQNLSSTSLEAYTNLLAAAEKDTTSKPVDEDEEPYNVTQNGAVVWTSTEKEMLFHVLDKKGLNGIKEIAAAIGTKSELEVMDYIKLLRRGLEGQHILERHMKTIVMGDIPAAAEISENCCEELDQYADVLTVQEELHTAAADRLKYGNNSIISDVQAHALRDADINHPLRGSIHLAASVLNLPTWIELSRRFFMNFGGSREEDNWTNIIQSKEESPSLTGDALMDFYVLTMSITRRLVHSALFFAMSRIRSTSVAGRDPRGRVRKRDVRAAIDVLNMKPGRPNFLIDFARRNGLVIADITNRRGWVPKVLSYDEAEEILDQDDDYFDHARDGYSSGIEDVDDDSDDKDYGEEDNGPLYPTPSQQAPQSPTLASPPEPSNPPSQHSEGYDLPFDAEEEHADTLDRELSRREELRLWSLLEKPGPPSLQVPIITEEEEKDTTRKPLGERRTREEMVDWRDRTLYRSEWEEYGSGLEPLVDELAENRRKRRRIEEDPLSLSASAMFRDNDEANEIDLDDDGAGTEAPVQRSASVVNSDDSLDDATEGPGDENDHPRQMDVDEEPMPHARSINRLQQTQ
ncbi:uncharacterized protein N7459_006658 [Penicillium hispanicum]|uniref:uncharacterized protein n=1 Tax=Penicillium hispanicum TaxID=1080232 RepID=UPI002540F61D|nr:uncharacterized protein N7459_006658 [Penicillium hispanicum]KAJ5577694.1 hypothetical protein N7459_006658 [Penicillium hispanicum]